MSALVHELAILFLSAAWLLVPLKRTSDVRSDGFPTFFSCLLRSRPALFGSQIGRAGLPTLTSQSSSRGVLVGRGLPILDLACDNIRHAFGPLIGVAGSFGSACSFVSYARGADQPASNIQK
jgi:hypothetical protein